MGIENINNINKTETEEGKQEDALETIEAEKNPEGMENIKKFVDEEKELFTKDNIEEDKEKKESRTKTFFKKAIIGTTIMVSLWSMGKMDSNKVEASESNTQVEQREDQEKQAEGKTLEEIFADDESEESMEVKEWDEKIDVFVSEIDDLVNSKVEQWDNKEDYHNLEKIDEATENLNEKSELLRKKVDTLHKINRMFFNVDLDIRYQGQGDFSDASVETIKDILSKTDKAIDDVYDELDDIKSDTEILERRERWAETFGLMSRVTEQSKYMVEEVIPRAISGISIEQLEKMQEVADKIRDIKDTVEDESKVKEIIEELKKEGKLEDFTAIQSKTIEAFDNLHSTQKEYLEKKGVNVDDIKDIKEILEKYLTE